MKTYKQRLPIIDKAIFALGGEWPSNGTSVAGDNLWSCKNTVNYMGLEDGFQPWGEYIKICTRTEFEARVADWRRLYGYGCDSNGFLALKSFGEFIQSESNPAAWSENAEVAGFNWQLSLEEEKMQYEYGVEYETNGEKPDLPDDVLVNVKTVVSGGKYKTPDQFKNWSWPGESLCNHITHFRIVDERYKPRSSECNGEGLPPVGLAVDLFYNGDHQGTAELVQVRGDESVWWNIEGRHYQHGDTDQYTARPLRTERDEAIHQGQQAWIKHLDKNELEYSATDMIKCLYDAGWRPTEGE